MLGGDPFRRPARSSRKQTGNTIRGSRMSLSRRGAIARRKPGEYETISGKGGYATVHFRRLLRPGNCPRPDRRDVSPRAADPLMTYRAIFDIGGTGKKADAVSIWVSVDRPRNPLAELLRGAGQPLATHVAWLRENGYVPSNTTIILPHDGVHGDKVFDVRIKAR